MVDTLGQRVSCPECDVDLAAGSLETHQQIQHRVGQGDLRVIPSHPLYVTMMYRVCFLGQNATSHGKLGMPREGHKLERPHGPLHVLPLVGHASGPGGG